MEQRTLGKYWDLPSSLVVSPPERDTTLISLYRSQWFRDGTVFLTGILTIRHRPWWLTAGSPGDGQHGDDGPEIRVFKELPISGVLRTSVRPVHERESAAFHKRLVGASGVSFLHLADLAWSLLDTMSSA